MAIKIKFDTQGSPLPLRMVLSTRSGAAIGEMPIDNVKFRDDLGNGSEVSFNVYKAKCLREDGSVDTVFWKKITDFKLAWCPEHDLYYELKADVTDRSDTVKSVTATSLGESELSQINVYGLEINSQADILRDDYTPTVIYDPENPEASLLDRLLYKAPHYRIAHVDESIAKLQRTFTFDDVSVYDAFQEIAQELGCLFIIRCTKSDEGGIDRAIYAHDLWNVCNHCGERTELTTCENCGSTDIEPGYGKNTSLYIDKDNLADELTYTTDTGSVKNCFRLSAGDDLMTAAVIGCNPNGSQYLWHIPDYMMEDMSDALRERLEAYNKLYDYYQNTYEIISV